MPESAGSGLTLAEREQLTQMCRSLAQAAKALGAQIERDAIDARSFRTHTKWLRDMADEMERVAGVGAR